MVLHSIGADGDAEGKGDRAWASQPAVDRPSQRMWRKRATACMSTPFEAKNDGEHLRGRGGLRPRGQVVGLLHRQETLLGVEVGREQLRLLAGTSPSARATEAAPSMGSVQDEPRSLSPARSDARCDLTGHSTHVRGS